MQSKKTEVGLNEDTEKDNIRFSTLNCLTQDQETMIAQRLVSVLKGKDKVPGEGGEKDKARQVTFSKAVRDEVNPLLNKAAKLEVARFNSIHETIYERASFLVNELDPILRKWDISFRWFCKTVAEISGIQSRGSWNDDRIIFKVFGEALKTDPYVRKIPKRKLLICAKHDDPLEFIGSQIDLIHKSSDAKLEELVTGRKREKREPAPDRHYKQLGIHAYWNEEGEELKFKGMTPEVQAAIYDLLENLESEAEEEVDNALSTILDDGSIDWTEYWVETAKNSEITISYTTDKGQPTFWNPEQGQVPYGTWAAASIITEALQIPLENQTRQLISSEYPFLDST